MMEDNIKNMCDIIQNEMETCKRIKEHFVNNDNMNKKELAKIIMDVVLENQTSQNNPTREGDSK